MLLHERHASQVLHHDKPDAGAETKDEVKKCLRCSDFLYSSDLVKTRIDAMQSLRLLGASYRRNYFMIAPYMAVILIRRQKEKPPEGGF